MNELKVNCIIGIDPGANGGIAVYCKGNNIKTVSMPSDIKDLIEFLNYYKSISNPLIFLENLTIRPDDIIIDNSNPNEVKANMGKMYRIQTMMRNFERLKLSLELNDFPCVLVSPIKWQSALSLRYKKVPGVPYETKTDKKNRFKKHAELLYPGLKVTLKTSDAILLMHFGRIALNNDISYIAKSLKPSEYKSLFK